MVAAPRVLIIVQNLPVPLDRRVWLESQALRDAGYRVSVICPRGPADSAREVIDDIAIYRYRPAPPAAGVLGFAFEFAYSWLRTAALSVVVRRERGFDVIQACNPPDTYWLLALLWRVVGVRFVFDHHDLSPELFRSRFGEPRSLAQRLQYKGLLWLERRTFATADRVISTNESYRRVAQERGGVPREHVEVVRSGPDTTRMRPIAVPRDVAAARHLLAYLGIMGPQDDVHVVIELMDELVRRRGRDDVHAVLMGFGDTYDDLRSLCARRGLDDVVTFTGRVGLREIGEYLSAASVGIGPDRKSPLNDRSTMNKTMEYMAYAVPPVSFDLDESRHSAAGAGVFVPSGDVAALADAVEALLDDEDRRTALSLAARRRAELELDWRPQRARYVRVFDGLLGRTSPEPSAPAPTGSTDPWGRPYVDISEPGALEAAVRSRGPRR
jgi:glycosyltransferase involved in cell wall biosynthesis